MRAINGVHALLIMTGWWDLRQRDERWIEIQIKWAAGRRGTNVSRGWAAILCECLIKRNATQSAAERRQEESKRGNGVTMVTASTFISCLRLENHQSMLSPAPHENTRTCKHEEHSRSYTDIKHMSSAPKLSELDKLDSIIWRLFQIVDSKHTSF